MSAPESYNDALTSATRQIRAEMAQSITASHNVIGEEIADEGIVLAAIFRLAAQATCGMPLREATQEIGLNVILFLDLMIEARAIRLVEGDRK